MVIVVVMVFLFYISVPNGNYGTIRWIIPKFLNLWALFRLVSWYSSARWTSNGRFSGDLMGQHLHWWVISVYYFWRSKKNELIAGLWYPELAASWTGNANEANETFVRRSQNLSNMVKWLKPLIFRYL